MSRRRYEQPCSLARALDRIGERWSLLIVRELALGPLRFSELAREVGDAPSDILTRRLRDLERDGIVRRRDLEPPVSGSAYELTAVGRGLERPMLELGRWGMHYFGIEEAAALDGTQLPNALRIILVPPKELTVSFVVDADGRCFSFRISEGWVSVERGRVPEPDFSISGEPVAVLSTVAVGAGGGNRELLVRTAREAGLELRTDGVTVEGEVELFDRVREAVVLPDWFSEVAEAGAPGPTRTS